MFLSHMMKQTMSVKAEGGPASGGRHDPTWGATRTQKCRELKINKRISLADGTEVTSTTTLATDEEVTMGELVFPPGASTSSNNNGRRPFGVDTALTINGDGQVWLVRMP